MPKLCSALEIDGCLKKVPLIATLDAESVCIFVPTSFVICERDAYEMRDNCDLAIAPSFTTIRM